MQTATHPGQANADKRCNAKPNSQKQKVKTKNKDFLEDRLIVI
jgi:hypothetical protein